MIILVTDVAYMLIPDKILLFFIVIFMLLRVSLSTDRPGGIPLLGQVVGFSLLLSIAVVSKGGMGGGDIKLFAVIGFVLGMKIVLLSLLFAAFMGHCLASSGC